MSELLPAVSDSINLFVNGKPAQVTQVEPDTSLLEFLRKRLGLTGTKLGCAEGGCGACTVMVQHFDGEKIVSRAVNACLAPIASMDGHHVITVEGIGSTRSKQGLHPVQQRIADFHGSQCGFCTPGIVMALYAFLRNNPKATLADIEESMDGNLCRCTGYRPILDAAKTFASDIGACPMGAECCKMKKTSESSGKGESFPSLGEGFGTAGKDMDVVVTSTSDKIKGFEPLAGESQLIFPPKLMKHNFGSLKVFGSRCSWFRPSTLDELLTLKSSYVHAKVIVGNTELGIETKFKGLNYSAYISVTNVPELNIFDLSRESVTIGSAYTLSNLRQKFTELVQISPKNRIYKAFLKQLKWFASNQIRNVAAIGSNIVTASPISDLNPVLQAVDAKLKLALWDVSEKKCRFREVPMREFFLGYRKVNLEPKEVLVSIEIPLETGRDFVSSYKQARRREDDIAIVTTGMKVSIDFEEKTTEGRTNIVTDICLSFGGMAPTTVMASKTMNFLRGKVWNTETITKALDVLKEELYLPTDVPGGMPEFRQTLAASFLFKFYLESCEFFGVSLPGPLSSAASSLHREVSHGTQAFQVSRTGAVHKPHRHATAYEQVSGEAHYVDDIPVRSDELYAHFVLTAKPKARILSVDWNEVQTFPGVVDIVTIDDVTGQNLIGDIVYDEPLFVKDEVESTGQFIGVVIATSADAAERASRLVAVKYEEAEAILSIEDAVARGSFLGEEFELVRGDSSTALSKSDFVLEGTVNVGGQEHFYLETQACIAIPGEGGEMEIISSTQNPNKTQGLVARALGVPHNRVVCKVKRMGGGFGGKESRSIIYACGLAIAARKVGKPVRCMLNRDMDMATSGTRHPFVGHYKVGFSKDGLLNAMELQLYANGGYSFDLSVPVLQRAMFHAEGVYHIPHVTVKARVCKTNLPSNTAFRGFGGPQGIIIMEQMMEHISWKLGMKPEDLKEKNLQKEGDYTYFGQKLENYTVPEQWFKCRDTAELDARRREIEEFNKINRFKKRGIAMVATKFGISFTAKFLNQIGALVHVYTDGSVLVSHGGTEMGQGLHTKIRQIAAQALGTSFENVFISNTATDKVANTPPTAASQGSDLNGMAVFNACQEINKRLKPLREAHPDKSLGEIAKLAFLSRIDLSAHGFYAVPYSGFDFVTKSGNPFNYFTTGVAVSEVEVDTLTGDFQVRRADVLMDLGSSVNPAIDIGQIEGAFVQGMGWSTMEETVIGDTAHKWVRPGHYFTKGPGAYKIPSFNDVPIDFRVSLLRDAPSQRAIYSSRAVGEPPFFLGSSVFFAIRDAIRAAREDYGDRDHFILDSPATAERIRMGCLDEIVTSLAKKDFRARGSF